MTSKSKNKTLTRVVTTIDYEIFGNGTGDVLENMVKPTYELLKISNSYDTPITLMADVAEILKFKEYNSELKKELDYSPYEKVSEQLVNAIKTNNDVQLHLHPQWQEAEFKKGKWDLNFSKWRTGNVPIEELDTLIEKSKSFLENLLRKYKQNYSCLAFRAGGLCIQPEEKVLQCLIDNGIKIETSVAKGLQKNSNLSYYDFRNMPSKNYWKVNRYLDRVASQGIYEIPITTVKYNFFQKLYYFLLRKFRNKDYYQPSASTTHSSANKRSIRDIFTPKYFKLDINYMHFKELKRNINYISNNREVDFIILIGHSKNLNSVRSLEKLIQFIKDEGDLDLCTFQNIVSSID